MKTLLKATLASALLSGFAAPAAFAADVVIGVPNWPSTCGCQTKPTCTINL